MSLVRTRPNLAVYIAGFLVLAMAVYGPIAQPADYHNFADQRTWLGIAHAGDVLSNIGFLLVGAYGAWRMLREGGRDPAHAAFFGALALTALGSSTYHLAPDNARLVWDRLPIALACASLLSAEIQRAWPQAFKPLALLVPMMAFGALSVVWWSFTGDLRPYLLIQVAPLVIIPALHWQTGAPMARRTAFVVAIVLYMFAKLFELSDAATFQAFGFISGHTIKHLLATVAAFILVRQLGSRD